MTNGHGSTNSMASAFSGREKPELIGRYSADLNRFLEGVRKFQKQHDLAKEELANFSGIVVAVVYLVRSGFATAHTHTYAKS